MDVGEGSQVPGKFTDRENERGCKRTFEALRQVLSGHLNSSGGQHLKFYTFVLNYATSFPTSGASPSSESRFAVLVFLLASAQRISLSKGLKALTVHDAHGESTRLVSL